MDKKIKSILEFTSIDSFNSKVLEAFLARVQPKVNKYYSSLCNAVYEEKYVFNDERLSKISNEFKARMTPETIHKLTTLLN